MEKSIHKCGNDIGKKKFRRLLKTLQSYENIFPYAVSIIFLSEV
jgi:hypothetical protein